MARLYGETVYAHFESEGTKEYQEVVKRTNQFGETYYQTYTGQTVDVKDAKPSQLKQLFIEDSIAELTNREGRATAACIESGWFHVCTSRQRRKSFDDCSLSGSYCGTYVVVPEENRGKLTELTLAILDVALNDPKELKPKAAKTVEVTAYLNSEGKLATDENDTVFVVKQQVDSKAKLTDLYKSGDGEDSPSTIMQLLNNATPIEVKPSPSSTPRKSFSPSLNGALELNQKLQGLSPNL